MPTRLLGLCGHAHWVTATPNPARAIVQHQVGQVRPQTRGLGTFGAWCAEAPILRLDLCRVSIRLWESQHKKDEQTKDASAAVPTVPKVTGGSKTW